MQPLNRNKPLDLAQQVITEVFKAKTPPNAIFAMNETTEKHAEFEWLEEGLYRRRNHIFARVRSKGKLTWRSTKTNKLTLARQWKEKWDRKQWLEANGFVSKGNSQ